MIFLLQLSIEQGFGGPESKEIGVWMIEAVDQWFTENNKGNIILLLGKKMMNFENMFQMFTGVLCCRKQSDSGCL